MLSRMRHRLCGLRNLAVDWCEAELLPRYRRLQPREQRLLQVSGLLLPALVVVFGLMLPLHDKVGHLRSDVGALAAQAKEAETFADELRIHGRKAPRSANPMSGIEQAAQLTKVRRYITRIKPDLSLGGGGQRLIVNMKSAPYAAVIRFIGRLRSLGMSVSHAKLYALDQPGLVDVEMTLAD